MHRHHSINYLEIPCRDPEASKAFFARVFGWTFTDYGPDYSCFVGAGIDGGFFRAPQDFTTDRGCPLIVLYSADLNATQNAVTEAGGRLVKPVFAFPGGRRFHFIDPSGNEYAAWSE